MSDQKTWREVGGERVQPRVVTEQVAALLKLKEVLEGVVAKEQANVKTVREQLHRMRHGGGS